MANTGLDSPFDVPEVLPVFFLNVDQKGNEINVCFNFLES